MRYFDLLFAKKLSGGGGGGSHQEDLIWTNPNPTDDISSELRIPISLDDLQSYDYVKVVFKPIASQGRLITVIRPTSEILSGVYNQILMLGNVSGYQYVRQMPYYQVEGGANIYSFKTEAKAYQISGTRSVTSVGIPIEIYLIK